MVETAGSDDFSMSDYEQAAKYKDSLNYQMILSRQIDRIARFRDINIKQYASSVDTLIIMLSKDMRGIATKKRDSLSLRPCDYNSMNIDKQSKYDDLWVFINNVLEDRGLIFRTQSFERGKED